MVVCFAVFFSSRRRHTRCALVTGVQTCALPICFLANLLSHPVVSGFITASGIIIAFSQFKSILGVSASGETLPELIDKLVGNLPATHLPTLAIGAAAPRFLILVRKGRKSQLVRAGLAPRPR